MVNRLESYFPDPHEAFSNALDAAINDFQDDGEERSFVLDIDGEDVPVTFDELLEWNSAEYDGAYTGDYLDGTPEVDPIDQYLEEQRSASARIIRESQRLHGLPVSDEEEDDGDGFLAA